MRKVDGWPTLDKPIEPLPLHLAAGGVRKPCLSAFVLPSASRVASVARDRSGDLPCAASTRPSAASACPADTAGAAQGWGAGVRGARACRSGARDRRPCRGGRTPGGLLHPLRWREPHPEGPDPDCNRRTQSPQKRRLKNPQSERGRRLSNFMDSKVGCTAGHLAEAVPHTSNGGSQVKASHGAPFMGWTAPAPGIAMCHIGVP